jgi:hypothetical protein
MPPGPEKGGTAEYLVQMFREASGRFTNGKRNLPFFYLQVVDAVHADRWPYVGSDEILKVATRSSYFLYIFPSGLETTFWYQNLNRASQGKM